ncbi:hypothetical protein DAERI_200035 [Deinococcus aerius]|uniref:Uncharacterized protein n=1 Tax=Deinococcus aerius TaxID=200253 RepID=A0A2I9DN15_9DEIO|nr:hypothetical protein DAERI_200035 [Deinococcus aerius]
MGATGRARARRDGSRGAPPPAPNTTPPDCLAPRLDPRWREWYDHRIESYRFPQGAAARLAYVLQGGQVSVRPVE